MRPDPAQIPVLVYEVKEAGGLILQQQEKAPIRNGGSFSRILAAGIRESRGVLRCMVRLGVT